MTITKTITVGADELFVSTPTRKMLMRYTGTSRTFEADSEADIKVTKTGNAAFPPPSSWSLKPVN